MVDFDKNYVGRIQRVQAPYDGHLRSYTGIVYHQEIYGDRLKLQMFLTDGNDISVGIMRNGAAKISSVRMEKDLRTALTALYKAKMQQKAFQDAVQKELMKHEDNVYAAKKAVQEASGDLTHKEFMDEAERLFSERYPRTGGWQEERYFDCTALSEESLTMTHIQDVEKHVRPEDYPFIGRRYDQTLFLRTEHPEYRRFCERNAPAVISELKSFSTNIIGAAIGDKNFLSVGRSYTFPLKHGLTKQSLQELSDILDGKIHAEPSVQKKKTSLNDQIRSAGRKAAGSKKETAPKKNQNHSR